MIEKSRQEESAQEALVGQVAGEFSERLNRGERPAIDEYCARYPEAASVLREVLAALEAVGPFPEADVSTNGTMAAPPSMGELGDFRIVREVGRGGMGVVYEAEQISLRRRVALKVLPFAATMDPRHLRRFQNEAQAAAGLHHTNIVPVYFVGSERGVHFYAMQFIDGQPLSELIQQLRKAEKTAPAEGGERTVAYQPSPEEAIAATPTVRAAGDATPLTGEGKRGRAYFRRVAEWGVQAAEALDHAHQLGIVHRDIKPANLLLDGWGTLWVTDFGLAQVRHGEAGLTMTGDLVGTLRYMSPEQALAQRVVIDHRTDVYSLGATLYELLTLRPVFDGDDRQELLRQIAFEEPVRPRRLNKTVPVELELIVLKAMGKRPQDRYATAQELADDLERWLRHEPIRARRPTLVHRAAKWGRRHQPIVAAGTVVMLMALALAGYIAWARHDRAMQREGVEHAIGLALDDSVSWQEQRRLPEALSAARRANGLLAGADVDEALRQQVRTRLADLELLDKLENVRLEKMTADKDGYFDREGADALFVQTFRDAGLDVEAMPAEEVGERIRRSTVAAELAAILDHWACIRQRIRGTSNSSWKHFLGVARAADPDAWRTPVREALERRDEQALWKLASSEEAFHLPPATLYVLGFTFLEEKKAHTQTEAFLRGAQRRHPDDFWINHNLMYFFVAMQPPQPEEAIRFAAMCVALRPGTPTSHFALGNALKEKGRLDEAIDEYREAIRIKEDYSNAHYGLGHALHDKGRLDEAIDEYRKAIWHMKDFPMAHTNLGNALKDKGLLDEAIAEYKEAIGTRKDFPEAYKAHFNLGNALKGKGLLDEAIAEYKEAIRLKKDSPKDHFNLGNLLRDQGRLDEAIAEYRKAIRLKKDFPEAHNDLGGALRRKGRLDEAIAEFKEAIRLKRDYPEAHNNLGVALMEKGRVDEAIAEYQETIRLKDHPAVHNNLGNALRRKGHLDGAVAEYKEAIRLKKDFPEAHINLGIALEQTGRFAEALACYRRVHELSSRNPRWRFPSAQWVRNCERLVELDDKLAAILSGQKQPADTAERLMLAWMCQQPYKQRHAAAVRFYREAFAAEPKAANDLNEHHRYNAACAAALAGCGRGEDSTTLEDKEHVRLRQQALDWLHADLAAWRKLLDKGPDKARPAIAQQIQHWLQDPDFAGVRGSESLARLPEGERREWYKLWEDVEALRQRVAQPPNTASSIRP